MKTTLPTRRHRWLPPNSRQTEVTLFMRCRTAPLRTGKWGREAVLRWRLSGRLGGIFSVLAAPVAIPAAVVWPLVCDRDTFVIRAG